MSDTGVPMMNGSPTVHGTFRTFPIRVANRPEAGEWSGPSYHDSAEITFESIGQQQELTTVTKLPRRIFTWSQQQAMEACYQSNIQVGFLNFAQYPTQYKHLVDIWERLNECTNVQYLGFGPSLPDRDAMSTIAKLLEEIGELIASERMSDPMELADVAILVLDLFHLQQVDMHQAVMRKMTKNRARRWKRQDNGALSHV
jgi:NTP pyrophosphatase (non-canonical NTP hydrolase)